MRGDAQPCCRLQLARDRRQVAYPDEFGIEQDICDITLWLMGKFRLPSMVLWVGRHYVHQGRQIADVTAITSRHPPGPVTTAARAAFLALGYEIQDTGADKYLHQSCDGNHARHEALRAHARIEAALRKRNKTR